VSQGIARNCFQYERGAEERKSLPSGALQQTDALTLVGFGCLRALDEWFAKAAGAAIRDIATVSTARRDETMIISAFPVQASLCGDDREITLACASPEDEIGFN
jgi:hypothetical protein